MLKQRRNVVRAGGCSDTEDYAIWIDGIGLELSTLKLPVLQEVKRNPPVRVSHLLEGVQ